MRPGIHPSYQPIVFRDKSAGFAFLTRSTLTSSETIMWEDGNTYPVYDVEVSSASHPFWTGQGKILDTAGRVEKFERRYGKRKRYVHRRGATALHPRSLTAITGHEEGKEPA